MKFCPEREEASREWNFGQIRVFWTVLPEMRVSATTNWSNRARRSCLMKRSSRNGFINEISVKMKVIEILEARAESLSVKEIVALLKISKSLVYKMIATGELPASRYHRGIRLDPNHVIEWVTRHTWQPAMAIPPAKDKAGPGLANGLERAG
jgi:excisionase family DNA binding protein